MRQRGLVTAILQVLWDWHVEGIMKQALLANAPKKLTTEWEELKQEVIAAGNVEI